MIPLALAGLGVMAAGAALGRLYTDLTAVARDAVFTDHRDGLFLLDTQEQIMDLNRAAERILGRAATAARGQAAAELFTGRLYPLLEALRAPDSQMDVEFDGGDDARVYSVRVTPLAA